MTTLDQRIAALSPFDQLIFATFLDVIEQRPALPKQPKASLGAYDTPRNNERLEHNRRIGARLRAVRETLRQSEGAAANVAGVTLKTYQQYEQGRIGRWSHRKLMNYCRTWNVSLDWLFDGSGTMFVGNRPPKIDAIGNAEPEPEPEPASGATVLHFPRGGRSAVRS